jgi:hypothetical protein
MLCGAKTALHDAITHTLATISRPLLTLTNRANTDYDTIMEEPTTGLTPEAPAKRRPADIMIRFSLPVKQTNRPVAELQLLDIALPHPPSSLTVPPGLELPHPPSSLMVPPGFKERLRIKLKHAPCNVCRQTDHTPRP